MELKILPKEVQILISLILLSFTEFRQLSVMQHLNLLQIQENGISELNFDAAQ